MHNTHNTVSMCTALKPQANGGGPNLPSSNYVTCVSFSRHASEALPGANGYYGYPTIINHGPMRDNGFYGVACNNIHPQPINCDGISVVSH